MPCLERYLGVWSEESAVREQTGDSDRSGSDRRVSMFKILKGGSHIGVVVGT
jgi:hypothetical protein